jgi:IS5 family transposase
VKPPKYALGDKAYDSTELREDLHEQGTKSVIPNRCNRKQPFSFNRRIYKLRWRIENAFNRLKDFRRIATRYDRLTRNYLASVCLAARNHATGTTRGQRETLTVALHSLPVPPGPVGVSVMT